MRTTWRKELIQALETAGEAFDAVVSCTLTGGQLDETFDNGYGSTNGTPFTAWTKKRVYFPVRYDGSEWVGSVSRHPDGEPTNHIGG